MIYIGIIFFLIVVAVIWRANYFNMDLYEIELAEPVITEEMKG